MSHWLLLPLVWVIFDLTAMAQKPEFEAVIAGNEIPQNTTFRVEFVLRNATGSDFIPPDFGGIDFVGGPAMSTNMMSINGEVTQSQSWSYVLLARNQGQFTIGPATVVVGRKKLTTQPLKIRITPPREIPAEAKAQPKDRPIMLFAEVEGDTFYPGQQILLQYVLYTRENVQSASLLSKPDYQGFFMQPLRESSSGSFTQQKINGYDYAVRPISSIALYAHQSGRYVIDSMIVGLIVEAPGPPTQGFFRFRNLREVTVGSSPLPIQIFPLPANAPLTFTGAVGEYEIKTIVGETDISTDEALIFQLEITGDGDARRWDPPRIQSLEGFEIFEPKIISDRMLEANGGVLNRRTIEYQLLPQSPGTYRVQVPFTYFDPRQRTYVTVSSDTLDVMVRKGSGSGRTARVFGSEEHDYSLQPVHRHLPDRIWASPLHIGLAGLILCFTVFGLILRGKRKKDERIPQAERARSIAGRKAIESLDRLDQDKEAINSDARLQDGAFIFERFLAERFMIPTSELTGESLGARMTAESISTETMEKAAQLYRQCLAIRFGGFPADRALFLEECRDMIMALDKPA